MVEIVLLTAALAVGQAAAPADAKPEGKAPAAKAAEVKAGDAPPAEAKATDAKTGEAPAADAAKEGEAPKPEGEAPPADAAASAPAGKAWYESGAMGYMIDGGLFMWPILFCGILAAGVIIERYRSLKMAQTDTTALRQKVLELLSEDRIEEAFRLCESQKGPVAAILSVGLRRYLVLKQLNYDSAKIEEQVLKAMDDYGVHIVAALEKHLPVLATVSSVAPMLGFLGTVQGMVISFADIVAKKGQGDIVQLAAAGIMVALLTTVFGLIVGIPAFSGFNYFTSIINGFVLEVEESASELIEAVTMQLTLQNAARGGEGAESSLAYKS